MATSPKNNEVWWFMWPPDTEHMYSEDGQKRPIITKDFEFQWGQYEGMTLADVSKVSYIEWLLKTAVEKKDWWQEKLARMRLLELS